MEPKRMKRGRTKLAGFTTPQREERQRAQRKKSDQSRVRIGSEADRWARIKTEFGLRTDAEVAKMLIDSFEISRAPESPALLTSPIVASTPVASSQPGPSKEVSDGESSGSEMSGVAFLPSSSKQASPSPRSSPISDPLDFSVEYEERGDFIYLQENESESEGSDWGSEEGFSDVSEELNQSLPVGHEEVMIDEVIGLEEVDEAVESSDAEGEEQIPDVDSMVSDRKFITYQGCLHQLLAEVSVPKCSRRDCSAIPELTFKLVGSAMDVKWICSNGHMAKRWSSQPRLRRNYAGDVALSAAIILSGNNHSKVAMLFKCMNMGVTNPTLHASIQSLYTFPAIEEHWHQLQTQLLSERKDKEVIIAGDGRNDSPGFSAKYCTYTTMDYESLDILDIRIVDKREVDLKSVNMEKYAFVKMLEHLKSEGLAVKEVITDAHSQIAAFMRQNEDMFHSYDVWHGSKNIGKKVAEAAKKAKNRPLLLWCKDITNHFWFCASKADDNFDKFLARWRGILHHVVDRHEWALGDGGGPGSCEHGPLPEEWATKKLEDGGEAHTTLREIVLNERLLQSLHHYQRFRHTHMLENFQSHILAYAAKRFAYGYPSYKARNLLAAIDYQYHKGRKQKTRNGEPVFTRNFSKSSGRWSRVPVMEAKTYPYIDTLMKSILVKRLEDNQPLRRNVQLSADDPRRLAPTIRPVDPPSVAELVARHESRL